MAQTTGFSSDIKGKGNDGEEIVLEILQKLGFVYDYIADKHYHYDFEINLNGSQNSILKDYFLNKSNGKKTITLDSKNNLSIFSNGKYYVPLEIVNNGFLIANYDYLNIFNNQYNGNTIRKENKEFIYLNLDNFLNLDIFNLNVTLNNKVKDKQILLDLINFKNKKILKDTLLYLMGIDYQNTYYFDNFNLGEFDDEKLNKIEKFYNENKELVDKILNVSQNLGIPVYLMFSAGWSTETGMQKTDFIASLSIKDNKIYFLSKDEILTLVRQRLFDKQNGYHIVKATLNKISNKIDQQTGLENIWQSNYGFVNVPENFLTELNLSNGKYNILYYK